MRGCVVTGELLGKDLVSRNVAWRGIGMGARQASEPFFSAIFSAVFLGQVPTLPIIACLLPIVGGVALASFTEASFNMTGCVLCLWPPVARRMVASNALRNPAFNTRKAEPLARIARLANTGPFSLLASPHKRFFSSLISHTVSLHRLYPLRNLSVTLLVEYVTQYEEKTLSRWEQKAERNSKANGSNGSLMCSRTRLVGLCLTRTVLMGPPSHACV
jgi:hypothetical protein